MSQNTRLELQPFQIPAPRVTVPVRAEVLRDNRLSLAARGLYAVLAAMPRDETEDYLAALWSGEFWSDIPNLLKELESFGYLSKEAQ